MIENNLTQEGHFSNNTDKLLGHLKSITSHNTNDEDKRVLDCEFNIEGCIQSEGVFCIDGFWIKIDEYLELRKMVIDCNLKSINELSVIYVSYVSNKGIDSYKAKYILVA